MGCQSASAVVEGAADVHGIDAQPVEQLVRGLRQLLDDVVDPGPLVAQAQVPHEVGVRDRGDAGAGRGAQVDRQAVRLAVLDRGQDPLTGAHGRAGGHEAYSAGSVQRVPAVLADELDDEVVRLSGDVARDRVVGHEDVAAAIGRPQAVQDLATDLVGVAALPDAHVAVAAERQPVAQALAQLDDVQVGLGLQRVVAVEADLDHVLEVAVGVAAAVVDDGQAVRVGQLDDARHGRLEVLAPVGGAHEEALAVGHVTPDDQAVQQAVGGLDLGLGDLVAELADAQQLLPEALRVLADPGQRVELAQQAGGDLARLGDAAVDREVRAQRRDGLDPRRAVALEAVTDPGDLVVARLEVAPPIVGVVELEGLHLLDAVRLPADLLRHGQVEALADGGLEAGLDDDLLVVLADRLEGPDVGVHVGDGDDEVEVVVVVGVRVCGQPQLAAPALPEASPRRSR